MMATSCARVFTNVAKHPSTPILTSMRGYSVTRALPYTMDNMGGSRSMFGGSEGSSAIDIVRWPIRKRNNILNVVPEGQRFVVERLGKLHDICHSGYFFAIPFFDQISYVIDVRERAIDIQPQAAITKDNVSVQVSGNVYVQFVDPEKAAYGANNPLYAVTQHAQSAMRSAIGEMELDEILHGRARLNTLIKGSVQEAAVAWGLEIRRYEITEIRPDEMIRESMDKQAAAERTRRELVLQAEGEKRRAELTSEGVKIKLMNESEGNLTRARNEAEATKVTMLKTAEGESLGIKMRAEAQAEAIAVVATQLQKAGGDDAAKLALARDYVTMYGEMGSKSNTMMFNDRPADLNALLAQASLAISATSKNISSDVKPVDPDGPC
uniref:Band 7 domain-containing protein n=1 Tax=Proboscia inermis TaxID=420281 RepID=A0A7S0G971_9STRA|mmetsp:Transcript_21320/g.21629  ORF Transcript_21320/g.21629 Transcript_21320/m.21629 type:complete len:381 (+) Transcript_21320:91-1233(+)